MTFWKIKEVNTGITVKANTIEPITANDSVNAIGLNSFFNTCHHQNWHISKNDDTYEKNISFETSFAD
jgi:hypothetical protein